MARAGDHRETVRYCCAQYWLGSRAGSAGPGLPRLARVAHPSEHHFANVGCTVRNTPAQCPHRASCFCRPAFAARRCARPASSRWKYHARRLASMSALLSARVPRKRWSGRTQRGMSQRCSTQSPAGTGPLTSSHATRWAALRLDVATENAPYPFSTMAPRQSQHPSVCSTFGQNRSASVPRMYGARAMPKFYHLATGVRQYIGMTGEPCLGKPGDPRLQEAGARESSVHASVRMPHR